MPIDLHKYNESYPYGYVSLDMNNEKNRELNQYKLHNSASDSPKETNAESYSNRKNNKDKITRLKCKPCFKERQIKSIVKYMKANNQTKVSETKIPCSFLSVDNNQFIQDKIQKFTIENFEFYYYILKYTRLFKQEIINKMNQRFSFLNNFFLPKKSYDLNKRGFVNEKRNKYYINQYNTKNLIRQLRPKVITETHKILNRYTSTSSAESARLDNCNNSDENNETICNYNECNITNEQCNNSQSDSSLFSSDYQKEKPILLKCICVNKHQKISSIHKHPYFLIHTTKSYKIRDMQEIEPIDMVHFLKEMIETNKTKTKAKKHRKNRYLKDYFYLKKPKKNYHQSEYYVQDKEKNIRSFRNYTVQPVLLKIRNSRMLPSIKEIDIDGDIDTYITISQCSMEKYEDSSTEDNYESCKSTDHSESEKFFSYDSEASDSSESFYENFFETYKYDNNVKKIIVYFSTQKEEIENYPIDENESIEFVKTLKRLCKPRIIPKVKSNYKKIGERKKQLFNAYKQEMKLLDSEYYF